MHLPAAGTIEPKVSEVTKGMRVVDIHYPIALNFVRFWLQFEALDLEGDLGTADGRLLEINGEEWSFDYARTLDFYLLERDSRYGSGTKLMRYLLLPSTADYWKRLDGKLPYLEFVCNNVWHTALGQTDFISTAAKVRALIMAELTALLPDPVE